MKAFNKEMNSGLKVIPMIIALAHFLTEFVKVTN